MFIISYYINNFLNFFLLLIVLNSFLLIDSELIIFFSISFVIILFSNILSENAVQLFNMNFISYYYNYIKYFNMQLYNLYELARYLNLNLFIYNVPFYLEYFNLFKNYLVNFYVINIKLWIQLIEFNYFKLIQRLKIRLLKFYFNYYFLVFDQVFYLFPRLESNNSLLLLDYYFQNNLFVGHKIRKKFNVTAGDVNFPKENENFSLEELLLFSLKTPPNYDVNSFHNRMKFYFKLYHFKFTLDVAKILDKMVAASLLKTAQEQTPVKKGFFAKLFSVISEFF